MDIDINETIRELEEEMLAAANNLEFEKAALLRDQIRELKRAVDGSEPVKGAEAAAGELRQIRQANALGKPRPAAPPSVGAVLTRAQLIAGGGTVATTRSRSRTERDAPRPLSGCWPRERAPCPVGAPGR